MGDVRSRRQRSALVARRRVTAPATQPRVLSPEQSDSKSDEETSMATAKPPQSSLRTRALAHSKESVFVSVGALGVANSGKDSNSPVPSHRPGTDGTHSGS